MYRVGDTVYVYDSNLGWAKACIIRRSGNYYHVRLMNRNCAYRSTFHNMFCGSNGLLASGEKAGSPVYLYQDNKNPEKNGLPETGRKWLH